MSQTMEYDQLPAVMLAYEVATGHHCGLVERML